jgi:hypothetical protein
MQPALGVVPVQVRQFAARDCIVAFVAIQTKGTARDKLLEGMRRRAHFRGREVCPFCARYPSKGDTVNIAENTNPLICVSD